MSGRTASGHTGHIGHVRSRAVERGTSLAMAAECRDSRYLRSRSSADETRCKPTVAPVDHRWRARPRGPRRWLDARARLAARGAIDRPLAAADRARRARHARARHRQRRPRGRREFSRRCTRSRPAPSTCTCAPATRSKKGQALATVISPELQSQLLQEQATLAGLEAGRRPRRPRRRARTRERREDDRSRPRSIVRPPPARSRSTSRCSTAA